MRARDATSASRCRSGITDVPGAGGGMRNDATIGPGAATANATFSAAGGGERGSPLAAAPCSATERSLTAADGMAAFPAPPVPTRSAGTAGAAPFESCGVGANVVCDATVAAPVVVNAAGGCVSVDGAPAIPSPSRISVSDSDADSTASDAQCEGGDDAIARPGRRDASAAGDDGAAGDRPPGLRAGLTL